MGQDVVADNWLAQQYAGKRIHFGGKDGGNISYTARNLLPTAGAIIVNEVNADLDLLVIGNKTRGVAAAQKQAEKLNAKGAKIEIVGEDDFGKWLLPTRDEAIALIRGGNQVLFGLLNSLLRVLAPKFDLSGADLSGLDLSGYSFYYCVLNGANFSDVTVTNGTQFGQLREARFDRARLTNAQITAGRGCSFVGAEFRGSVPKVLNPCDFTGARFHDSFSLTAPGSCFAQADFSGCELYSSEFIDCDLRGANFSQTRSRTLKLTRANLSGADFRGADLLGADFSGANVSGARFEGAQITGVVWEGVDRSQAAGLSVLPPPGPEVSALAPLVSEFRLVSTIVVDHPAFHLLTLGIDEKTYRWDGSRPIERWGQTHMENHSFAARAADPSEALLELARRFPEARPREDSLKVTAPACPPDRLPELTRLTLLAWREALSASAEVDLNAALASPEEFRSRIIAQELRGGPAGVALWNARSAVEVARAGSFEGLDLAGQALAKLKMKGLDLKKSRFDEADLQDASFLNCDMRESSLARANLSRARFKAKAQQARFEGACLAGADLAEAELAGACFHGADLSAANLAEADLTKADLGGADLSGATLNRANLCGANLTAAKLAGTALDGTRYDEKTVFPQAYTPALEMRWAGKGANPFFNTSQEPQQLAPISYEELLKRLRENTQREAFAGATVMLRSHRYKLYCDTDERQVVGVVRSQSDSELVYSCQLASDGAFACCTQNLKPCGGLRGKLCKHILLLLIGLTRAGQLAPERADLWMMNSRRQRPLIDKDRMSETFLRYQSAQAEEIDWRPTETVPEDFLAL